MPLTVNDAVEGDTVMVVSTGVTGAVTVTLAVPLTVPPIPLVAVMVVVPAASAVNTPAESIVPTAGSLLLQTTAGLIVMEAPFWS